MSEIDKNSSSCCDMSRDSSFNTGLSSKKMDGIYHISLATLLLPDLLCDEKIDAYDSDFSDILINPIPYGRIDDCEII